MPARNALRFLAALALLVAGAAQATNWNSQEFELYAGDFDGDGKDDILYVAKDPSNVSGIARSDGSQPNIAWQTWPSNYLGIPWSGSQYNIIVRDFNGDGRTDIFMQRKTPGDHYLLLTTTNGKVTGIDQAIPNSHLGLVWSADQHRIVAGDFDGDNKADLFLQSISMSGLNAVVVADSEGKFTAGPTQSWNNGAFGLRWSANEAFVHVGDFNGDNLDDLLIQARPKFVMIDYDVTFPVPTYPANLNGMLRSQGGGIPFYSAGVNAWSRMVNGVDWSPLTNTLTIGNFDGYEGDDVLFQPRNPASSSKLLSGTYASNGFGGSSASALSGNLNLAGSKLVAGRFAGGNAFGLYVQTSSSSGTSHTVTVSGASFTATAHAPSAATGTVTPTLVGRTPGAFSVTSGGAASYSIPIVVPPGVSGMQPNLAIAYQSGGGNGYLGVGWSLSGLSEIERCKKTIAQDGANAGITLASDDGYCLEGNRLRLTGGTYGAAGSTYQTELEQFSRVTANGTAGNGPASFVVEAKDGLKYEYGNTADSRIESTAPGLTTTARVWALNKISDRYGNAMTVTYAEDGSPNGSFRPLQIDYTSNASTSLSASYRVKFEWEARPSSDILTQYFAGGLIRETNRLNRIETYYKDPGTQQFGLVRKYQIAYNTSGLAPRSRIHAIQECDKNGACLSPTQISWQDGEAGFGNDTNTGINLGSLAAYAMPIDINGDGRTDLVYPYSGTNTWYYNLANAGGGYASAVNTGIGTNGKHDRAIPMDYNADGLTDILVPDNGDLWQALLSNGSGFSVTSTGIAAPASAVGISPIDVDGDGRQDLVYPQSDFSQLLVRFNSSSGLSTTAQAAYTPSGGSAIYQGQESYAYNAFRSGVQQIDVNGDARGDLAILTALEYCNETSCNWFYAYDIAVSTGTGFTYVNGFGLNGIGDATAARSYRPLDLNADGLTDMAHFCDVSFGNQEWCISYGTGAPGGVTTPVTSGVTVVPPLNTLIVDWDSDGSVDLLQAGTTGNWKLVRSSGESLLAPVDTGLSASDGDRTVLSDLNGDGLVDMAWTDTSNVWHYRLHRGTVGDLVRSVVDGFGNYVNLTYAPLTDASVYTIGGAVSYPKINVQAPMYVVKSYLANNGQLGACTPPTSQQSGNLESCYQVTQSYAGLRASLDGRGLLGFASRVETDSRTGINTTTAFLQDYPFIGAVDTVSVKQSNGKNISNSDLDYTSFVTGGTGYDQRLYVYNSMASQSSYEVAPENAAVDGILMTQEVTVTSVDSYGTPWLVTVGTTDHTSWKTGTSKTVQTTNTISNDVTNWCLGFVTTQAVTNTVPGQAAKTRTVQTDKDLTALDKCRASQQIVEPNDPSPFDNKVTTLYGYDNLGHVATQTVSAAGIANRVTTTSYGTQGVFPVSVTNAENEVASKTYDYALGVVKTATDANNLMVTASYDTLGRKTQEVRPDGTKSVWTLYGCTIFNGYCGDGLLRYQVVEEQQDAASAVIRRSVQYSDSQGRTRYTKTQALTGAYSFVATEYDDLGRVKRRSQPYFEGSVPVFTTMTYDILGRTRFEQRQVSDTDTSQQTIEYRYALLANSFIDAMGKTTLKQHNAVGQVERVTDPMSNQTNYSFDPFGNLLTTADPAGNTIANTFSIRGFKLTTNDPDMGNWIYTYFPTGELKRQTDAKGQLVDFTYDKVGRQKTRVELEGTTTWNYGTSATYTSSNRNIGQLVSVTSPGAYSETLTYDSLARSKQVDTVASGTTYVVNSAYDANTGLLDYVTYPTSTTAAPGSRFKAQYTYAYGQLKSVRDYDSPSTVFWQALDVNAAGQAIDEQAGNTLHTYSTYDSITGRLEARTTGATSQVQNLEYDWDKAGNLTRRRDNAINQTELFYYDNLYRLDYSTLNGVTNLDPSYDSTGNITNMRGLAYLYTGAQSGCTYTGLPPQPHAVRKVGTTVYCYDKNGNMTLRGGQATTWFSYNLPNQIKKTASTHTTFSYGASRARYKQVSVTAAGQSMPAGTETTIYIGSLYEKVTKPSGVIEHKHYLLAGGEAVALKTLRSNSVNDTRYLHKDHLGSVDAITNEAGGVVTRLSFDAFGKRRAAGTWSGNPTTGEWTAVAGVTHRGFTYHEGLDNVDLVHMNGRVYDPNIGRFLSADPIVQAPFMSQSLNRYSYVMNNPLSLIDPSGFSWLSKLFKRIVSFVINIAIRVVVNAIAPGLGVFLSQSGGVLNSILRNVAKSAINSAINRTTKEIVDSIYQPRAQGPPQEATPAPTGTYRQFSSAVHTGLSVVGMIPGVGVVADIVDAAYTAVESQHGYASQADVALAMSAVLASFVPGADQVAGVAKIAARQGAKRGLHRPYIRNSTREAVEARAPRDSSGRPLDPNTGGPIDGRPDLGHKPGNEFRREKARAEAEGLTQSEFNDRMNNPDLYQLESPSTNRSRIYEQKP